MALEEEWEEEWEGWEEEEGWEERLELKVEPSRVVLVVEVFPAPVLCETISNLITLLLLFILFSFLFLFLFFFFFLFM